MTPESWKEVLRLFEEAQRLAPAERGAFVERAPVDAEVKDEVLRMLTATPPRGFLEEPTRREFDGPETPEVPFRLGDFTLLEEIGRGGMGLVNRARQHSLERDVAVKLLPNQVGATDDRRTRFLEEARKAAGLRHANIVPIHVVHESEGIPYFAMELVKGPNLGTEISALARGETPTVLSTWGSHRYYEEVGHLLRQVSAALQHAHERRIVHRDVKPQNILLEANGTPRLVDFGIARDESLGSLDPTRDTGGTRTT